MFGVKTKKMFCFILSVALILQILPMGPVLASSKWVATPFHDENGNLMEGLKEATEGKLNWAETTQSMPAEIAVEGDTLTMSNGSILRKFHVPQIGGTDFYSSSYQNTYIEKELLNGDIAPDAYLALYSKPYREIYEGMTIKEAPDYFFIGGNAQENAKWTEQTAEGPVNVNTFVFDKYEIFDTCEKPFDWEPRSKPYSDPAASDWPPKGKRVEFTFSAPDTFPAAYQGIKVKVIYEIYDNLAAMKKRVEVVQTNDNTITIGRLAPEVLQGNQNMKDLMYIETSYTGGNESTIPFDNGLNCECANEADSSPFIELKDIHHTCYDIGPAYELPDNLGRKEFISFETYELVYSTYWFEQQSRERLGMYRKLFPWVTDNPLTFHHTGNLTKEVIDMVAGAGFEMIIQSYGSSTVGDTNSMLTRDKAKLDKYKELVDYARSKNIDIGIYQAQYQLTQYKGSSAYGTNDIGQWNTWCLASEAFDDYWDNFKYFLDYTGINCVEIDGTYPNCLCDNGEEHVHADKETDPADPNSTTVGNPSKYAVHNGYFDSKVKQWENVLRTMNKKFRDSGIYIKVPAWYYVSGGNKCGIGYEEIAWSQPRQEQLIYARQLMHNASYARTMSMSWSHIPFVTYLGGGSAAAFTPFKNNKQDYNWVLAQNMGNGITSDFRGTSLYDDETQEIMQKWVAMFNKYRGIVNSDFVHMAQASYGADVATADRSRGIKMDTLFHANANNPGEKGLLWVYNQTDEERTETITVPMYYTGLTDMNYPPVPQPGSMGKDVHTYGQWPPNYSWLPEYKDDYQFPDPTGVSAGEAVFAAEGIRMIPKSIDSNGNVTLEVTLPPMSFTYYTIYDPSEAPDISISVGRVAGLYASKATENSISIAWNKDVSIDVAENGAPLQDHELKVDYYQVYRNGEKYAVSYGNTFTDKELNSKEVYEYSISAIVSGVEGPQSKVLSVITQLDDVPPQVSEVTPLSRSQVSVSFDEAVDEATAALVANYQLSGDSKVILAKKVDPKKIILTVEPLTPQKNYTLTIQNIKDISGNLLEKQEVELSYGFIRDFQCNSIDNKVLLDSINGENGKISNLTLQASPFDKALVFEASKSSYADLGSEILKGRDTYSVSLWVNPAQLNDQVILSQGQEGHEEDDFTLSIKNGYLTFRTSDSEQEVVLTSQKPLTDNSWSHVSLVRKQDQFELYQNGILEDVKSQQEIGRLDNLNFMILGAQKNHAGGDKTNYYTGLMDNVAFYSYALSAESILMQYYESPKVFEPLLNMAKSIPGQFYEPQGYQQIVRGINSLEGLMEQPSFKENLVQNELYISVIQLQTAIDNLKLLDEYRNIESIYTMDEKDGAGVIDSITGRSAQLIKGDKTRIGTPFGRGIFVSDYIGNYIIANSEGLAGKDSYTLQGFIKPWAKNTTGLGSNFVDEYAAVGNQVILADENDGVNLSLENGYLKLTLSGEGQVPLVVTSNTEIKYDTFDTEKRQAWNNFAVVRNGDEFILYLNGIEVAKGSQSGIGELSAKMYLGADKEGKDNFNGILDEFVFYSNALASDDILNNATDISFNKVDRVNVAKGKTPTASASVSDIAKLTDSKLYVMASKDTPYTARGASSMASLAFRIDLGKEYSIDALSFTFFSRAYGSQSAEAAKFRAYRDVVIQVADDSGFTKGVKTVYNSDKSNNLGLGVGNDMMHYSTDLGYDIVLDTPVTGRYVRITSGGFYNFSGAFESFININELEVFGLDSQQLKTRLEGLVTDTEGLDTANYTEESVERLSTALENAKNVLLESTPALSGLQNSITAINQAVSGLAIKDCTAPRIIKGYPFGSGVSIETGTLAFVFDEPVTAVSGKMLSVAVDGATYQADVSEMTIKNIGLGSTATIAVNKLMKDMTHLTLDFDKNYAVLVEAGAFIDAEGLGNTQYDSLVFSTSQQHEKYQITIAADEGGSIVKGESGTYSAYDIISLEAKADHGYKFSHWTVAGRGEVAQEKELSTSFFVLEGDAQITAHFEYEPPIVIPVESVALNTVSAEIKVDETLQLSAVITPDDATSKAISWSSDKENVASVDQTGKVTARGAGTANITVTTEDGGKTATCIVTVSAKDGGNGDNNSGGTGTPPVTTPEIKTDADGRVSIVTKPEIKENTSKAILDANTLNAAFEKAAKDSNGGQSITINIPGADNVKKFVLELPANQITADIHNKNILLETPAGTITLPSNLFSKDEIKADRVEIIVENTAATGIASADKVTYAVEVAIAVNGKIIPWDHPKAPFEVSIDYRPSAEEKQNTEKIAVRYVQDDGTVVNVINGRYSLDTGKVTFAATHLGQYAIVYAGKHFADMDMYNWAKNPAEVLLAKGIVSGTSINTFSPGQNITRGDFMLMLVRTLGLEADVTANFDDVGKADYYYEAIGIAKKLGIASGIGNNTFNPKAEISRQDMMVLVAKAMEYAHKTASSGSEADLDGFADTDLISGYAMNSVATLVKSGLIAGKNGRIDPVGKATRAEMAVVMYKLYNK